MAAIAELIEEKVTTRAKVRVLEAAERAAEMVSVACDSGHVSNLASKQRGMVIH